MAMVKQQSEDGRAGAKGILGDVLYANKARAFVFETEWVELVQSIAAGDQRALYCLYDRTHRIVFTLAVRITNNRETARRGDIGRLFTKCGDERANHRCCKRICRRIGS